MNKRLHQILEFLAEIEKLKLIKRVPYLSDQKTIEDDTQHSWHLAMMLIVLEKEIDNKFDMNKALKLALIHDLVEIYTGDDWVTTAKEKARKRQNEVASANKIFPILPNDLSKEMRRLWEEYDAGKTTEAKIVKGLDKLIYSLQYNISEKINWFKEGDTIPETIEYAKSHIEFEPVMKEMMNILMKERTDKETKGMEAVPGRIKKGTIAQIVKISNQIPDFDQKFDANFFQKRCLDKNEVILVAYKNNKPVGYVLAYDRDKDGSLYCWMAGVMPKYRRLGMLKLLMEHLEIYAKKHNYQSLKVKTRNTWRGMLAYLINSGYNIIEATATDKVEQNRILFIKELGTKND